MTFEVSTIPRWSYNVAKLRPEAGLWAVGGTKVLALLLLYQFRPPQDPSGHLVRFTLSERQDARGPPPSAVAYPGAVPGATVPGVAALDVEGRFVMKCVKNWIMRLEFGPDRYLT